MNKRIKLALVLIAIILIATLAISVAYSRYFSEISGKGSATVAKWSFKVNDSTETVGTINLADTVSNDKVAEDRIAPGTSGSFDVELDASGTEVALDYTISFSNISGSIPTNLHFYEDSEYTTEIKDISSDSVTGSIGVNETSTVKKVTIYWKWDYQTGSGETEIASNDSTDTTEGETTGSITFDVVVTGTQQANS